MRELELKEIMLLEEIKEEEKNLGDEIVAAGVFEDDAFDASDDAYVGLVEQYRNLVVGYNAIKYSTQVEEVRSFVAGLEVVDQVPLAQVIERTGRWVRGRGWHLAGSHKGNSSQLYRLLAEEVGELLAELDKGRPKTAAHESGDVLAYVFQFIWEFDLGSFYLPENKRSTLWVALDKSFAELQRRKAEEICSGRSKGLIELRDVLLRLHRCPPISFNPGTDNKVFLLTSDFSCVVVNLLVVCVLVCVCVVCRPALLISESPRCFLCGGNNVSDDGLPMLFRHRRFLVYSAICFELVPQPCLCFELYNIAAKNDFYCALSKFHAGG
jgi:hypothetical protein